MYTLPTIKRTTTRQSWLDKVTSIEVLGMDYDACVAMQGAANFEGAEYEAKVAEFKAIALEVGIINPSGTLARLHALITAKGSQTISKRLEFGA